MLCFNANRSVDVDGITARQWLDGNCIGGKLFQTRILGIDDQYLIILSDTKAVHCWITGEIWLELWFRSVSKWCNATIVCDPYVQNQEIFSSLEIEPSKIVHVCHG